MPNTVKVLKLTTDEKNSLECLLRCPTTEARKYIRAKILLLKSDSYTNEAIADKLDITVPTVRLCLQKYFAGGIDNALNDCKGKGRKQEISDDDITWVVNKACQKPLDYGFSAEFWYPASFTRFIQSIAVKEGHPRLEHVSEFSLRKILANAKIRPFKVTYYCEKRDPDFDSKMHNVLVIYKQVSLQFDKDGNLLPFEGTPVHTLSYDEKPGIQAIGSTTPDLPPISNTEKGSSYMRDYEYIRYGTISLLAAIDLLTGEALKPGDVLIGMASTGVHSNGFSLVRKVFDMTKESLDTYYEELGTTLGEALIAPTRIYVKALKSIRESGVKIHACSHITGGGFYENIPRMLKEGTRAVVKKDSYPVLPIFKLLAEKGNIDEHMMYNTYNMGLGMILAVDPADVDKTMEAIRKTGDKPYVVGTIEEGEKGVTLC